MKTKNKVERMMNDSSNVMKFGNTEYLLPKNEEDEELENEWNLIDQMRRMYQNEMEERQNTVRLNNLSPKIN